MPDVRRACLNLLPQIKEELAKLKMPLPEKWCFVAGSIFMAKANLMKPFLLTRISDFLPTDGRIKEGTKAHFMSGYLEW